MNRIESSIVALLNALDSAIPDKDRQIANEYNVHGESGLALEHICYSIMENDIHIAPDALRHLMHCSKIMGGDCKDDLEQTLRSVIKKEGLRNKCD